MENLRTVDSILTYLHNAVQEKQVIAPSQWVEAAQYLNVLQGDEHDLLFDMQQNVSQVKLELLKESKSVAEVKLKIEALDIYKQMRKQEAKIRRTEEFIRIAKLQARMKDNEWAGQK